MQASKYGNWITVEELGSGGQGTVYRVVKVGGGPAIPGGRQVRRTRDVIRTLGSPTGLAEPAQTRTEDDLVLSILHHKERFGALKKLHEAPDFGKALARMEREVKAVAQLEHRHLVKLLDHSLKEHWVVWQYHERGAVSKGENPERYKGNALATLEAVRGVVSALAHMHAQKPPLVHRDVKTDNILVADDGRLVLTDLGLVFFDDPGHTRVTETFESVGSQHWMPPWTYGRRLKVSEITPVFDVFAAGKVLYCLACGEPHLPQWYQYMKDTAGDRYDLEKLFPNDPAMKRLSDLISAVVVGKEVDCPRDASALLEMMKSAISDISALQSGTGLHGIRKCRACGVGTYGPQGVAGDRIPPATNTGVLAHFGLRPDRGTYRIEECDNCGHVDLFRFGRFNPILPHDHASKVPPAWRE